MPRKILVVDDEKEILALIEKKFSSVGYQVFTAAGGEEAVRKSSLFQPDLVLMDIVLPDMDGADAVKQMQENSDTRRIPVVFLSGIIDRRGDNIRESVIRVGDFSYLAIGKPVIPDQLLQQVEEIIAASR